MAKIGKFAQITARVLQRIIWPTKIYGAENFEKFNGGIIISNHYASASPRFTGMQPTPVKNQLPIFVLKASSLTSALK